MEMHLSGIPVLIRGFVSTLTLEQAARVMASHEHQFQRVTTLPGSILLSGVYNERHWVAQLAGASGHIRSEEHTSELQSLMRISYAVFFLKTNNNTSVLSTVLTSLTQY